MIRPLIGLIAAGLVAAPVVSAEEADRLEMWEEPSHQLVFAEGSVRVLDIRIAPGTVTDYHKHRFPTAYILIQDAQVLSQLWDEAWTGSTDRPLRDAGATVDNSGYVDNPYYHRVRNVDDRSLHVVAIINERVNGVSDTKSRDNSSDTTIHNRWFREHRIRVGPESSSEYLAFPNDVVLVQFTDGPTHALEDGVAHSFKNTRSAYSWHPAGSEFSIVNQSRQEMEFVLIEVKK